MKLSKAIEILEIALRPPCFFVTPDIKASVKLGIQALKKIKAVREGKEWVGINPLPGEDSE